MVSATQIENVLRGAIHKASENSKVSCKETMLIITTEDDDTAEPVYIVQNSNTRKKLLFAEIYSGMMSGMVEKKSREILSKSLSRFANDHDVNPTSVRVKIITNDDHADKMYYFIEIKTPEMERGTSVQKKLDEILQLKA